MKYRLYLKEIRMRAIKEFSISELGRLIHKVESIINKGEPTANRFIFLKKSARFLKLDSLKRAIMERRDPGFANAYMRLYPDGPKTAFRMLYQAVFNKVDFFSSADVIVIRANINLFFFSKGMRVKLYLPGGVRTLSEFKNEITTRENIEACGLINSPRLLKCNLESEPCFFADKIIFGDLLTSDHPKTPSIFRMVIPQIWRFYQSNGIDWRTPREAGIDLKEKIQAYKASTADVNCQNSELDLGRIEQFNDRLIPSSLIHGDLSIKNILVTPDKNYIIDWETSRRDFIICDFFQLLLKKKWRLHDDINRLMRLEIENRFGRHKNAALSLSEQTMLAFLLAK